MAACDPMPFNGVTQQVRDCFQQNAVNQGVSWEGTNTSGQFSKSQSGVTVTTDYTYNPQTGVFTLTIADKPWFLSCDFLYGKMHEGLEACGGPTLFDILGIART